MSLGIKSIVNKYANKRVTVMGLGHFGGGVGAARFLAENGARVTVTDLKSREELSSSVAQLKGLGIRFVLGGHRMEDFTDTYLVVVSPAVPRDSLYVLAARKSGVPLRTEIGLFIEQCSARICGITGSNGKTTTVSMIGSILERSGLPHWVGGNIGVSLLNDLERISPGDAVVLEISSFQLEWLNDISWSPHIAAVLNIMPNHLDRHGSLQRYIRAKATILDYQKIGDRAVLVRDDPGSRALAYRTRGHVLWVGSNLDISGVTLKNGMIVVRSFRKTTPILGKHRLLVPGGHMVTNAMVAAACAWEMGIEPAVIADGLSSYRGLPHRLEPSGEYRGIRFYNDSKATTPEAAAAGVEAFDAPVVPILGGYDKGLDFSEMAQRIAGRVRRAAVIGQTAQLISEALEKAGVEFTVCRDLAEAFEHCIAHARTGDVILLSPGCASYDMFSDYEERGEAFKKLVREYLASRQ